MADTPKKAPDQDVARLAESPVDYGSPVILPQGPLANRSGRAREAVRPAPARAGVRAGFASWPEIPGPEECNVHALHAQLLFTQWMTPETLQKLQLRQIEKLLRHAVSQSPFYRERLKFLERLADGMLSETHFASLPVMTRQELQEFGTEISARSRPAGHGDALRVSTSGAVDGMTSVTGTGLVGAWDRAMVMRDQDWHGRDVSLSNLDIFDYLPQKRTVQGRWSDLPWSGPSTALSADRPTEHLFKDFMRIQPHYLRVRPSILRFLVERSVAGGIRPKNLLGVSCLGEYLDPEVRDLAEKTWEVPVLNIYSAPETGILALQCPEQAHFHIQSEYARVEVLDDDGRPCQPGEAGRVVVTPLHNYQTPLVRFATGDRAEAGGACSCGRTLPVLARVLE